MPDISMCDNIECSKRSTCYRYRAVPDKYWQSYASFGQDKTGCSYYWDVKDAIGPIKSIAEIEKGR